ncbi:helix-turn-helix domain-containing protein [Bacillus sp. JJ664]
MDKISNRRYQIIDILSTHDKWFKSKEVANLLNCTEKTILNDIQVINSSLPTDWHIDIKKGKGIYLHMPSDSTFDEIRSSFSKNFTINQALTFILIKEIKFISDLGTALYMQHTSVYKILSRIEEILKSYQLTLKRMPLFIEGSEFQKRVLCCDLLYNLYSHTNSWLFESYTVSDLKNIVSKAAEKHELFLSPPTTYKYVYYIGTMIHRILHKPLLPLHKEAVYQIKKSIFFSVSNEICDQIEKNDSLNFSSSDRISFAIYISHIPYFNSDQQDEDTIYTLFKNKANSYYNELYVLIDLLERNTGVQLMEDKRFVYTFHQQYKIYSLKKYFPKRNIPKDIRKYNKIINYTQNHYPELYRKVDDALECFTNKFSLPPSHNIATARATLNIQASVNYSKIKKRVLFLNSEGPGVWRYNLSKLEKVFGNKIMFVSYNKLKITKQELKELAIDFVISDFTLDIDNFPFIIIDPIITQREINEIAKYI